MSSIPPIRLPFPEKARPEKPAPKKGVRELSSTQEFDQAVGKKGLAIVSAKQPGCGYCPIVAPTIKKIAKEHQEIDVFKVDVYNNPELADALHIKAVPTVVFFKDGRSVGRVEGGDPEGVEKMLKKVFR